jgi:ribosomal protein S18 acetylase RimI-like enzyme
MTDDELRTWLVSQRETYIGERVRTGERPEEARRIAAEQYAVLFPGGQPAAGHRLSRVMDDDEPVGWLWIGPRTPAHPEAYWVWNVAVDEAYRGRGFGRAAMLLAEQQANEAGAVEIGLNVFGYNTVARRLYESLGYETASMQMRKGLTEAP